MTQTRPDLLAPREAADELGVSARTLNRYQAQGLIEPLRTPGGHRKFRRADVERLKPQPATST